MEEVTAEGMGDAQSFVGGEKWLRTGAGVGAGLELRLRRCFGAHENRVDNVIACGLTGVRPGPGLGGA